MEGPDRIPVGYIARAHGIRGAVIVKPLTDAPNHRFVPGASFTSGDGRRLSVDSIAEHGAGFLVTFVGVGDRSTADALRGTQLSIPAHERRDLAEDEYWPDQLIGCTVVTTAGEPVGSVAGVEFGPSQDRLVVTTMGGSTAEVPFVPALVPAVDIARRTVTVDVPDGLFD